MNRYPPYVIHAAVGIDYSARGRDFLDVAGDYRVGTMNLYPYMDAPSLQGLFTS